MSQRKKKANRRRPEEEEVPTVIPNWSELCPDLLRCVFKHLSFTELSRAKSVYSSWHTSSRGCVHKPNQIPWLILFPSYNFNNSSSCVLFVPDDKDNVYKTRDLGVDFVQSDCLATYGSWLLMLKPRENLYILNPLTGERIDLPRTKSLIQRTSLYPIKACFGIDNKTKDYLVVLLMRSTIFTNKGDNKWHEFSVNVWNKEIVYNQKNQKLYIYHHYNDIVNVWEFSGDKPRKDELPEFNHYDILNGKNLLDWKTRIAVTVSRDVLNVTCLELHESSKTWDFHIYKTNNAKGKWVKIDSLGDEALILDMGVMVVAKDIPGMNRNSIYFSGLYHGRYNPKDIFVYDLTTQKVEPLPKCVFTNHFNNARWFFPGSVGPGLCPTSGARPKPDLIYILRPMYKAHQKEEWGPHPQSLHYKREVAFLEKRIRKK